MQQGRLHKAWSRTASFGSVNFFHDATVLRLGLLVGLREDADLAQAVRVAGLQGHLDRVAGAGRHVPVGHRELDRRRLVRQGRYLVDHRRAIGPLALQADLVRVILEDLELGRQDPPRVIRQAGTVAAAAHRQAAARHLRRQVHPNLDHRAHQAPDVAAAVLHRLRGQARVLREPVHQVNPLDHRHLAQRDLEDLALGACDVHAVGKRLEDLRHVVGEARRGGGVRGEGLADRRAARRLGDLDEPIIRPARGRDDQGLDVRADRRGPTRRCPG